MTLDPIYTPHQAKYFAHFLTREGLEEKDALTQSLSSARVDLNPHQVDAAMFALRSPLSKGVLLADEVGLGKTIEAALVLSQRWWEHRRHLLLIVPASLRKQWATELREKFSLPSVILDAKRMKDLAKAGQPDPIGRGEGVIILSYEYASRIADRLSGIAWNLVVFDEAHKLRNVYKAAETSRAAVLRDALAGHQKLLLTATPLQNNLLELYGLVTVIDGTYFGSEQAFRAEFGGRDDRASQALLARRLQPICKRTLRRQVQRAGLINFTNRLPKTFDFTPDRLETELYDRMSAYLQREDTVALGPSGRHLVTLMLRKILGSSSFAIARTLDKMVRRLETSQSVDEDALDDVESVAEAAEEWREGGQAADADGLESEPDDTGERVDPGRLRAEIEELGRYRDLAASIHSNAKGKALLAGLASVLDEIVAKGGQRRAVIFTESVRTQGYLRDLLEAGGFGGQTVILNGSNADAGSAALHKAWVERHKGTDVVSGSKSADMKAAIVDAFRTDRTILIATESGAEAPSVVEQMLKDAVGKPGPSSYSLPAETSGGGLAEPGAPTFSFHNKEEVALAQTVLTEVLPAQKARITTIQDLKDADVVKRIAADALAIQRVKGGLFTEITPERAEAVAAELCAAFVARTIAIPSLTITPVDQVSFGFKPFTLDVRSWNYQPLSRELLLQTLRTEKQTIIRSDEGGDRPARLEDHLVAKLIDFDEVDYDAHAELLYDLAGQVVTHLRSYLPDDDKVRNVLQGRARDMAAAILAQMRGHMWRTQTSYRVTVNAVFTELRPQAFDGSGKDVLRDFRQSAHRSTLKTKNPHGRYSSKKCMHA